MQATTRFDHTSAKKRVKTVKNYKKKIQQLLEGMRPINLFQQDFFKKSELTSAHDTELSALRLNVRKINSSEAQFRGRASAVSNVIQELSSTKARRLNQTFELSSALS